MVKRPEKEGGRETQEKQWGAVLGLTFVLALVLALLIVWLYRPSEPLVLSREPGEERVAFDLPTVLAEGTSARKAYQLAAREALAWQPDARPAIVSAHWRPRQGGWSSNVVWTFQFYSASTRRLAVMVVDGSQTQLLQDVRSPYALPTFEDEDWQIDSREAVQTWWNNGGGAFHTTHSDVNLIAQLRVLEEADGRLVWRVTGVAGAQVRQVDVDGATGEQLDIQAPKTGE